MEMLRDDVTEETRKGLKKGGKATTDLIRKVLRDGMDTRKTSSVEEIQQLCHNGCELGPIRGRGKRQDESNLPRNQLV